MKLFKLSIAVTLALATSVAVAADKQTFTPAQKTAVEKIVHDYLVKNPEVLVEATQTLQQQQQTAMLQKADKAIKENRSQLTDSGSPVIGNPKGNVSVVEFFDYQCVHCKKMSPIVAKLTDKDGNLKVVMKQLPIFGENSEFAAKAALAAEKQGKFKAFHEALMAQSEPLTQESVMKIAQSVGLNVDQLKKDMNGSSVQDQLKQNLDLAKKLGLMGTPAFVVVGEKGKSFFVPGGTTEETLQKLVGNARQS
ncbi:MAG: DsbA family protein [Proteobacteria bacterium]|nr:DsbA family protein [Pseudomonadota bacterium]